MNLINTTSIPSRITAGLRRIESPHDCRILFAAEAGSRAWGFPSPDSDYDVRFVYAHNADWYLQLDQKRDTLEWFDNELDYSGWDLQKSLRLFAVCNPTFNEQLNSPIVYESDSVFTERIRQLIPLYFNPLKAVHHYIGIAENFIKQISPEYRIGIKKFFYIIRPLLAGEWIIRNRTMPPTEFSRILEADLIDKHLRHHIQTIRQQKETADEQTIMTLPAELAGWIDTAKERLIGHTGSMKTFRKPGWEPLNELFLSILHCR